LLRKIVFRDGNKKKQKGTKRHDEETAGGRVEFGYATTDKLFCGFGFFVAN